MAGDAGGGHRGTARRTNPASDSQQGRSLEFRAVHVLEYPESDHATVAKSGIVVGNGAFGCVRGSGTGARGPGARDQTEVALRGGLALGLVAGAGGNCDLDVGSGSLEDLEQHTHRDEPRAAPATAFESAHGRALQPDQSAFSF